MRDLLSRKLCVAVFGLVLLAPRAAFADWKQALVLVKRGDCVKAIPMLEEAEDDKHRPTTAYALAGCYVKTGELLHASDLYHALSEETVLRTYTRDDKAAIWNSKRRAAEVDERIPTLRFEMLEDYEGLEIEIDGVPVKDPTEPKRFLPDSRMTINARAKGRREIEEPLVLEEKERRTFRIRLEVGSPDDPPHKSSSGGKTGEGGGKSGRGSSRTTWLGVRGKGIVIPKFLMNAFGEGGATIFAPGADLTLTHQMADADLVVTAGYLSYRTGEMPFKLSGRPDTEYEILQSDMQAITATLSLIWNVQMDSVGRFHFRIGGGLGVGWMFAGDLVRTQGYPLLGAPDDPASYVKCEGPNSPAGQFRYCNQLDKDADHYGGYTEPNWFQGGARPLIFPWLAIPELGFTWRMTPNATLDLDLALTISGAMGALGVRFAL